MITKFIRNFIIIGVGLFITDWLMSNISFGYPVGKSFSWEAFGGQLPVLLTTTLVLTVLTLIARPILKLLSAPINFLTLGLFNILIDVFLFWLTSYLVPGFSVSELSLGELHLGRFFSYVAVSFVFGFLQGLLAMIF